MIELQTIQFIESLLLTLQAYNYQLYLWVMTNVWIHIQASQVKIPSYTLGYIMQMQYHWWKTHSRIKKTYINWQENDLQLINSVFIFSFSFLSLSLFLFLFPLLGPLKSSKSHKLLSIRFLFFWSSKERLLFFQAYAYSKKIIFFHISICPKNYSAFLEYNNGLMGLTIYVKWGNMNLLCSGSSE